MGPDDRPSKTYSLEMWTSAGPWSFAARARCATPAALARHAATRPSGDSAASTAVKAAALTTVSNRDQSTAETACPSLMSTSLRLNAVASGSRADRARPT